MSEATEHVISGLEGVLACESSIAYIDGSIPELSFRGYDIHDIAQTLTFEQVAFLIWHDRIPNAAELRTFSTDLAGRRAIPRQIMDVLRATPSAAHPMAGLRTAVSMLGALDPRAEDISPADNLRKALETAAFCQTPSVSYLEGRFPGFMEDRAYRSDLEIPWLSRLIEAERPAAIRSIGCGFGRKEMYLAPRSRSRLIRP